MSKLEAVCAAILVLMITGACRLTVIFRLEFSAPVKENTEIDGAGHASGLKRGARSAGENRLSTVGGKTEVQHPPPGRNELNRRIVGDRIDRIGRKRQYQLTVENAGRGRSTVSGFRLGCSREFKLSPTPPMVTWGSGKTLKFSALETPPPGAGLNTVTIDVPVVATSAGRNRSRQLGAADERRRPIGPVPAHHRSADEICSGHSQGKSGRTRDRPKPGSGR